MIFKVQVSLATSDGSVRILVYDREQAVTYEDEVSGEHPVLWLMAGRLRAFFRGHVRRDGQISLDDEVPDEEW